MSNIYKTTNIFKCEPAILRGVAYTHVKAKADGSETVVITEDDITDPNLISVTFDDAQKILDGWIDEENTPPLPIDITTGEEIKQSYINLGAFFEN